MVEAKRVLGSLFNPDKNIRQICNIYLGDTEIFEYVFVDIPEWQRSCPVFCYTIYDRGRDFFVSYHRYFDWLGRHVNERDNVEIVYVSTNLAEFKDTVTLFELASIGKRVRFCERPYGVEYPTSWMAV